MVQPDVRLEQPDRGGPTEVSNRCAVVARREQLDPGGTAASFDVLVLVERPLPWPADIADAPDIAEVGDAVHRMAAGSRCRVQTVIGVGHSAPEGRRRVLCYWATAERFDGFQGAELEVDADEIALAATSLMTEAGRTERRSGTSV